MEPIELLEERMALFQILHQTSNENMNKKHSAYTMNPKTRSVKEKTVLVNVYYKLIVVILKVG